MEGNEESQPKRVQLPDTNTIRANPAELRSTDSTGDNSLYVGGNPDNSPKLTRRGFLAFLGAAAGLLGLTAWSNRESFSPPAKPDTLNSSTTPPTFKTQGEKGQLESQLPSSRQVHSQSYTVGTTDLGNFPKK